MGTRPASRERYDSAMAGTAGSFDIGRFTGQCAATGEAIAGGTPFVASLAEAVDEGRPVLRRIDWSAQAWDGGARPEGLVCFWRGTAPNPGERRRILLDDHTLLEMVERLEGETDPRRIAYRWILALVLLRRKVLKLDRVERSADDPPVERWLLRAKGAPEEAAPLGLVNPQIRDEELRELADQLGELVHGEG